MLLIFATRPSNVEMMDVCIEGRNNDCKFLWVVHFLKEQDVFGVKIRDVFNKEYYVLQLLMFSHENVHVEQGLLDFRTVQNTQINLHGVKSPSLLILLFSGNSISKSLFDLVVKYSILALLIFVQDDPHDFVELQIIPDATLDGEYDFLDKISDELL